MSAKDLLIITTVVLIWGVNFWFMKIALADVPPLILGVLRFACVLVPAIFFVKKPPAAWRWLILYGLSISFGQFSLVFLALSWDFPTGLVALILQVQVFLTVIFAKVAFGEVIKLHHLAGMLGAAAGLFAIGMGQYQGKLPLIGILPVLGAAMSWACGNIVVKKIGQVDALSLVVWGSISSFAAFCVAASVQFGAAVFDQFAHLTWRGGIGVLFLAYVSSLVGYTGFGYLLARHPASKVVPFILFVPVVALLIGFVWLDESLGVWHWLGIGVVMAALLVHLFGELLVQKIKGLR